MAADGNRCSGCGVALPADIAEGLCPRCMMGQPTARDTAGPGSTRPLTDSPIADHEVTQADRSGQVAGRAPVEATEIPSSRPIR